MEKFSSSEDFEKKLASLGREAEEIYREAQRPAPELAEDEARFQARALEAISAASKGRILRFARRWVAAAAALLLIFGGMFLWNASEQREIPGTLGSEIRLIAPKQEFAQRFEWSAPASFTRFHLVIRNRRGEEILRVADIAEQSYTLKSEEKAKLPLGEDLSWEIEGENRPGAKRELSDSEKIVLKKGD